MLHLVRFQYFKYQPPPSFGHTAEGEVEPLKESEYFNILTRDYSDLLPVADWLVDKQHTATVACYASCSLGFQLGRHSASTPPPSHPPTPHFPISEAFTFL